MIQYKKSYPLSFIDDDNAIAGYTEVQPLGWKYFPDIPRQYFDESMNEWRLISRSVDAVAIDNMKTVSQLTIVKVFKARGESAKLRQLIFRRREYIYAWAGAGGYINLFDPMVIEALDGFPLDVEDVKRDIVNGNY